MSKKSFTFKEIKRFEKHGVFTIIGEPYLVKSDYGEYLHAECICECGKISIKSNHNLERLKNSQYCSIGCLKKLYDPIVPKNKQQVKIGERYGYFEVLLEPFYILYNNKERQQHALFKCHGCGRNVIRKLGNIIRNVSKSCGCMSHEMSNNNRRKCSLAKDGLKICSVCKKEQEIEKFGGNLVSKDGLKAACRRCERNRLLLKRHGISIDKLEKMYQEQEGKCSICHKFFEQLNLDHCHITNKVRELLCQNCNRMIGQAYEDVDILKSAIKYLEKHNQDVDINEYKTRRDLIIESEIKPMPGIHYKCNRWKERKQKELKD